jgi:hypothetical protein
MIGCPLLWKCILACRCGEESQQPTCPQVRHRRKCTHLEPILRQSSQPSARGVTSRIIFRCGSTISSPSLPVQRSAPRSGAISQLCGAQLILDRQLADSLAGRNKDRLVSAGAAPGSLMRRALRCFAPDTSIAGISLIRNTIVVEIALLHGAAIDPDPRRTERACYQALSHWPRLGEFR